MDLSGHRVTEGVNGIARIRMMGGCSCEGIFLRIVCFLGCLGEMRHSARSERMLASCATLSLIRALVRPP